MTLRLQVPARKQYESGFTLVELMVTVAIIAILASIANASYRAYVIRSHRSAAMAQMLDLANRQQQILLATRTYADKAALEAGGYVLDPEVSRFYNWDVTTPAGTRPTFLITFDPIGGQAGDGPLTLDSDGTRTPAEKWRR